MKTAFLLLALTLPFVRGDETVALRARHARGDVFEEKETFWSTSARSAEEAESTRPSFGWNEARARAERGDVSLVARDSTLEDEVLEVRDGRRVKIRRTFVTQTTTLADAREPDAAPRLLHAPFEGQAVVLVADGDGTRLVGEIDGEEELAASELRLASPWEDVLPPAPVAPGETWSLPDAVAARLLEALAPRKASAWCKLLRLEAGEAGTIACVQLELHASAAPEAGRSTEIEASGLLRWDLAAEHLQEVTLTGKLHDLDAEGNETTRAFGLTHATRRRQ